MWYDFVYDEVLFGEKKKKKPKKKTKFVSTPLYHQKENALFKFPLRVDIDIPFTN